MNSSRHTRWLLAELPALVGKGVLTADAADGLRRHYALPGRATPIGMIISAVLGATLLGAGVILILAHNWDELTRPLRTVVSFFPLGCATAVSVFVLLRRRESAAWRESAAIFQSLAAAAAIALVGQTWHIAGDFFDFIFTWMLLTLPLAYLLPATAPCALSIAGITVWAGGMLEAKTTPHMGLPMLALAVPFYVGVLRENRRGHRAAWLSLLFAIAVPLIVGFSASDSPSLFWIPTFAGLTTAMYLAGVAFFPEEPGKRPHPFRALGGLGIAVLSIVLSYRNFWEWRIDRTNPPPPIDWIFAVGWPLLALALGVFCWRKKRDANAAVAALPLIVAAAIAVTCASQSGVGASLIFDGFALVLGLLTLVRGIRRERIGSANAGLAIVAALVVARFFDGEFSFVARGVAFMLIGIGFLAANVIILRRRPARL